MRKNIDTLITNCIGIESPISGTRKNLDLSYETICVTAMVIIKRFACQILCQLREPRNVIQQPKGSVKEKH